MAVNFVTQKCACGGKLEFDPAKKIWICKYCGTVVEREATFNRVQVDGIEGVDDVVRQTLKDIANHKMESAAKNLEDCERKGHKHVGTLLANISFYLTSISVAKSQDEIRGAIDKVKIYGNRFKQEFGEISTDEINLYESFGEDASDIFANLLAVYDTLGDSGRIEYIASKLKPESVFSPHANKILLKVSIRRGDLDVVDKIVRNIGHLDRKATLQELLDSYPDNDRKAGLVEKAFDSKAATELSKRYFEGYFNSSKDSIAVKAALVRLLNNTDIHVNAETVVKNSADRFEGYKEAKTLFDAVYGVKLSDQETEALLVFCLMVNTNFDVQKAFFDTLSEKNIFVALNARAVISFLDSAQFAGPMKAEILGKMLSFNLDAKALDAVYNYYLNNNSDDSDTRNAIIDVMLVPGAPVSTATVRNYVVNTKTDGESKIIIIEKILGTGINKTYLGELLSDYMMKSADEPDIKNRIFDYLSMQGFKADSNILSRYIAGSQDDSKTKFEKVKRLIQNGTQVKSDTLDEYIQSINVPSDFSEELFNILTEHSYSVSINSYGKFLLFCSDLDKVRHNDRMMQGISGDLNNQMISIRHNDNSIECNVFQAYLLNATDTYETAAGIVSRFNYEKIKANGNITVNGSSLKFKKYLTDNKSLLSPLSLQLCEENKMFSLF